MAKIKLTRQQAASLSSAMFYHAIYREDLHKPHDPDKLVQTYEVWADIRDKHLALAGLPSMNEIESLAKMAP